MRRLFTTVLFAIGTCVLAGVVIGLLAAGVTELTVAKGLSRGLLFGASAGALLGAIAAIRHEFSAGDTDDTSS